MKRVMLLGCVGMAGHVIADYLSNKDGYDIYGVARSEGKFVTHILDVTEFDRLQELIKMIKPDYIINCVGVLVSASTKNICAAIQINSYLPHYLDMLGKKHNFKLIHISTDCVFSGRTGGYRENSFKDGDDNYARTKALGEVINEVDLTIRTSIIGPELKSNGTGLLDWFLKQTNDVNGYSKAYWSGVTTLELAKAIHEFIKQDIHGLFQLCPDERISKYDLLKLFSVVWSKPIVIKEDGSYCMDKSLVSTRKDFDYKVPKYKDMLLEMRDWMAKHSSIYKHYSI